MKEKLSQEELLIKFKQLMSCFDIDFCLMSGTLLGAYRDKQFISWDNKDIDLAIDAKYYWKVKEILKKSNWKFKAIWRREISIYQDNNIHPHIDIFFYEVVNNKIYLYSNSIDKGFTNRWNVERKHIFDKDMILPLKNFKFLNTTFKIPKKTSQVLEFLYSNNWKIPDDKWNGSKTPNIDYNHRQIAVIIPSFIRWEKTKTEIQTLLNTYNPNKYRFYIGNQGKINIKDIPFFHNLEIDGHKILNLPFDCGLSYARNFLIKQTIEPYIMIMDNDFLFSKNNNLDAFAQILEDNENIGLVGGKLKQRESYTYNLIYNKKQKNIIYLRTPLINLKTQKTAHRLQYDYFYTELTLNFFLAKREIFNDILWDNALKLVEHTDFFMRFKSTKWKVVYTAQVIAEHQDIHTNSEEYISYRSKINKKIGWDLFLEKWGLTSIKDIKTIEDNILTFKPKSEYGFLNKEDIKREFETEKKKDKSNFITNKEIISILVNKGYKICLMKSTCYQAVKKRELKETELHLGVENIKEVKQLFNLEKLKIYSMPQKTKAWGVYGFSLLVPYPVIFYLKKEGYTDI